MISIINQLRPHLPILATRLRSDLTDAIRSGEIDLDSGAKSKIEHWLSARIEAGIASSIEILRERAARND